MFVWDCVPLCCWAKENSSISATSVNRKKIISDLESPVLCYFAFRILCQWSKWSENFWNNPFSTLAAVWAMTHAVSELSTECTATSIHASCVKHKNIQTCAAFFESAVSERASKSSLFSSKQYLWAARASITLNKFCRSVCSSALSRYIKSE